MKSFDGYLKKKLGDSYALLAGGGDTSSSSLIVKGVTNTSSNDRWILKIIQGTDNGTGPYDCVSITSNDVPGVRISDSDGTQLGLCGGDLHSTLTSTHDFRFYTGATVNALIYSGAAGTLKLGLNYGGYAAYVNGTLNATSTITQDGVAVSLFGHTHTFSSITNKIINSDEFDFVDVEKANIYFNYKRAGNTVATTPTTCFHFCQGDGNGSTVNYASIKTKGFIKDGSSSSYYLTGDGGHALLTDLLTDLSRPSSTNNLSITIGGTTKAITLGARAFDDTEYLPLTGGTLSNPGRLIINGAGNTQSTDRWLFKVIQGGDIGSGLYDTMVISSSDVCSLRIGETDGTEIGLCGGDQHGTFISTHDFRFYTGVAAGATIYSGGGGTLGLTIKSGQASSPSFKSTVATGTSPYQCTSTTLNTNLNADMVDGYHLSDLYWANIKVQTGSDSTKVPTLGGLFVINDSSNNAHDGLVYLRHYSGNDWGLIIDKNNTADCGVDIRAKGSYSLRNAGGSRLIGSVNIGSDAAPSYTLHVRGTSGLVGDTTVGSKSIYYQRGTRGAIHHEIIGDDCDYGVMKIRHLSTEGSGGPGGYTASLAIFDERADTITGSYQPTFYINRSGATRTPALMGIDVGGSRKFTIDSSGNLTSVGSSTLGSISANTPFTVSRSYSYTSAFVRFSHGWEKAFTTYDDFILSSADVATLRICESDGTELGLCGGDGHSTITSSKDLRFYTACSTSGAIYSGASGTWGLTISGGNCTSTNFYTTSDRAKKQNISSLSEHIRKFQLKDTEKWHYGVIAQEVEEMFRDGEEGNMTVNYNSVLSYYVGLLENKVKDLEEKVRQLENLNK